MDLWEWGSGRKSLGGKKGEETVVRIEYMREEQFFLKGTNSRGKMKVKIICFHFAYNAIDGLPNSP